MNESAEITRELTSEEAQRLAPGSEHYTAYVGPPDQYDFMGATQFRLLCTLGLRERHKLLDFGCGSLRSGRLFIPYLNPGNYYGFEPNQWLVDDAVSRQIGQTMIDIKRPRFHFDSFSDEEIGEKFDFIVAQSIFSHMGPRLLADTLNSFKRCLKDDGIVAATFIRRRSDSTEEGWIYPGCVHYRSRTIDRFIKSAGLVGRAIPWYHPRQTWYLLAHEGSALPSRVHDVHLTGAVLRDSEFGASVGIRRLRRWAAAFVRRF